MDDNHLVINKEVSEDYQPVDDSTCCSDYQDENEKFPIQSLSFESRFVTADDDNGGGPRITPVELLLIDYEGR